LPITSATRRATGGVATGAGGGAAVGFDTPVSSGSAADFLGAGAATSDSSDRRTFAVAWFDLLLASDAWPSSAAA